MTAPAVRTTCPYCGVGCGVLARSAGGRVAIAGDRAHPANFGRLCSKGSALGETVGPQGRLLYPQIAAERVSWERALAHVAQGFARLIRDHGPDAVALYVSGQLLTEDYYVANKLMKGFVGTANIDTNSRLCMASAVAGHKRAFGGDLVPGCYEDLELADLIVLVGSNTAWCHPVIFQRIMQARQRRPELKLVVIDPRRTATCESADLHLPIRSGTDVWLFNGLLAHLRRNAVADSDFIDAHTDGLESALEAAAGTSGSPGADSIAAIAQICGIDPVLLLEFYQLFARTSRVVTAFSQGVNQSSAGTDKVSSIINCHLLTGRIGKPGAGPFSLTGQPNAMGGREVGGMANMLAAHMDLDNAAHRQVVQDFWGSPRVADRPGLKAVDLFEAIHAGRIKAVWIIGTNPVVSLPDADRAREALRRCELVVVSDCIAATDTTAMAHVLLPAAAWGEKDGTVTNSERRISRQRAFLPLPGEARPDWWIISAVARCMGFGQHFAYESAHSIFLEHARLSGTANDGARIFDIGALGELTRAEYDDLAPVQWPLRQASGPGSARLFADGLFQHPDGRARFIPTPVRAPVHASDKQFPFVLNTGRIRDQWHTMTRTGRSPRLAGHLPEPFVDLHAQDALSAGVRVGELARIESRWGSMIARVRTSGEMARGAAFVPIHWNSVHASHARAGAVVSAAVDPISGEPEFKHTPARIEPFSVDWYGFALSREPLDVSQLTWWAAVSADDCFRYEIAGRGSHGNSLDSLHRLLGVSRPGGDYLDYCDEASGIYRVAHVVADRLAGCIYISKRPDLPARDWLMSLFKKPKLDEPSRAALLAGRPPGATVDAGPLVCSCFGVRSGTIRETILKLSLTSVQQVGARLRAGTNCGSCLPEIGALLSAAGQKPAVGVEMASGGGA